MKRLLLAFALCAAAAAWQALPAAESAARLNIVLILADDLGAADLGCAGNTFHETPHLDALARRSVRFTQAYASAPVCSPTRAALLTGKCPARLGITTWLESARDHSPGKQRLAPAASAYNLPHSEATLAKRLQAAGYLTALVGKWHLGDAEHYPETHGFDINRGGSLWGAPATYFWPYRGSGRFGPEFRYLPGLDYGQPGEYLTDRLAQEALAVIDHAQKRNQPFFLYLAHHAPHTPIEAKPEDIEHFRRRLQPGSPWQHPAYAAMVRSLDQSVGRVLAHLEMRGLAEQTLVIFTSDNGGFIGKDRRTGLNVTTNAPLRSGKGSLYEGGLRVPLFIRWPGCSPAEGGDCTQPVITADLFFTVLAAAGLKPDAARADGLDLAPLLRSPGGKLAREALCWHFPHYYETTSPVSAVRAGKWKLLEYFEDGRRELYDLEADPGEQTDLAAAQSQWVQALAQKLAAWRLEVRAQLPQPNPDFKPAANAP